MSDGTTLATRQDAPIARQGDQNLYLPTNHDRAWHIATIIHASGMFKDIKTPEAAFVMMAWGDSIGLDPWQSVRAFGSQNGQPYMKAQTMSAICMTSQHCTRWKFTEHDATCAILEVSRDGGEVDVFKWDTKRAETAGLLTKDAWRKNPEAMLMRRCETSAANTVFPELITGFRSKEDLDDEIAPPVPVAQRAHAFAPNKPRHEVAALTQEAMEAQTAPVVEVVAETPAVVSPATQAALEVERDNMAAAELTEAIDGLGLTSAKRLVEAGHRTVDDAAAFIATGGKVRYLGAKAVEWCIGYMGDGADEEPAEDHSVLEGRIKALSECATGKEMWDYVLLGLVTSKHYETTRDAADVLRELTGAVDANDAMEIEPVEYSTAWVAAESMAVQKTSS